MTAMSVQKIARVVASERLGASSCLVRLEVDAPLGFVGGQYLIVNTLAPLEGGKTAKRAYSILSSDADQRAIELAVARLPGGPGSGAMHAVAPGDALPFSGPWGKLAPPAGVARAGDRALVVATDTGITAALGLVQGEAFASLRRGARVVWCTAAGDDFFPASRIKDCLEKIGCALEIVSTLTIGHPERPAHACAAVGAAVAEVPDHAFLSGDGHVIHALRAMLLARGPDPERVRLESFFHNPDRKAPSAAAASARV